MMGELAEARHTYARAIRIRGRSTPTRLTSLNNPPAMTLAISDNGRYRNALDT